MNLLNRLTRFSMSPSSARCLLVAGLAVITVLMPMAPGAAGPVEVPGWDLVWQDEFDGNSLNSADWDPILWATPFNNEKQAYLPSQVTVENGNLVLTATDAPYAGQQYRSGKVESKVQYSYGRFEARIKMPSGQGFWPAFWLLPETSQVPWPSGGEIDIMENRGSQPGVVSSAYHWGPDFFGRDFIFDEYTAADAGGPVNFHTEFHDYAVEWEPGVLRFFVDGNNYHTITESTTGVVLGNQAEIFDTPKEIVLNLAVGGDFGGDPNGSTPFPSRMEIDYVRVWERSTDVPTGVNLLSNPGFDDNGGSLNGWSTIGNSIPNVNADGSFSEEGTHALKIFGQFNGSENFSGTSQGVAITEGAAVVAEASALTPSNDTLFGKTNEVLMKIEFYSVFGGTYEGNGYLSEVTQLIHDGTTPEDSWFDHTLQAVAPTGAVEARLTFLFRQPGSDNGAIWIDSASLALASAIDGDFNNDGSVDQGDLDLVLLNWGQDASAAGVPSGWVNAPPTGLIGQTELDAVLLNWGNTAEVNGSAAPEPSVWAAVAVLGSFGRRLGRRAA